MTGPNDELGFITDKAAAKLAEVVQYYKTIQRGHNTNQPIPPGLFGEGPYYGVAQADIQQGSFGNVNFWSGTKGNEGDTGITVSVYFRWDNVSSQDDVLFDYIDQAYEALPTTSSANVNNAAVSCCGNCVPASLGNAPVFQLIFSDSQSACCSGMNYSGPITLIGSGDTWESGPIQCGGNSCAWILSIGSPFAGLSLTVGNNNQIEYRCPANQFSPLCANQLTLWQPTTLPGTSSCVPPCNVCVTPQQYNNCGLCPNTPAAAVVTITGATNPNTWMNGTFELSSFSSGSGSSSSNSCGFQQNNLGGNGVNGVIQAYRQTTGGNTREYQVQIGTTNSGGKFQPTWTYTLDNNTLPCDSSVVSIPLASGSSSGVPSNVNVNFTS